MLNQISLSPVTRRVKAQMMFASLRKYDSVGFMNELADACGTALRNCLNPELFRALGDPTRLALLGRLAMAEKPLTVTEASGCCGVHLSGVSRHLSLLKRAGIVRAEKRGREVTYELDRRLLITSLRGLADALDATSRGRGQTIHTEPIAAKERSE